MQLELAAPLAWPPAGNDSPAHTATLARLLEAEDQGFSGAWLIDAPGSSRGMGPSLHLATAWLAARTRRLRLGVRVALPESLHPLRLAEELATLDLLCDGRFAWAVGPAGADAASHAAARAARVFGEQLEIVEKAWTGEPFSHCGEFFEIPELQCLPRPVQATGPPVWIAAASGQPDDPTLAWAARNARPLWCDAAVSLAQVSQTLDAHREQSGASPRDARDLAARVVLRVHVGADDAQARRAARAAGIAQDDPLAVVGDAVACAKRLQEIGERLALDTLVCCLDLDTLSKAATAACQRRLAEHVLPRIS